MRILTIADIDDFHWHHGTGQADVLLSCGDVADQVIIEAAGAYGCARIFAVKGNHDPAVPFPAPITDLHARTEPHDGVRFGGLNGCWRYKPKGYFLYEQSEAAELLAALPAVDVFLSHNSPRGIHDREDEVHIGFDALNTYLARARPKALVHGHQHVDRETRAGQTKVIGVYGWKVLCIDARSGDQSTRTGP